MATDSSPTPDDTGKDPTFNKIMRRFRESRKYTMGGFWDTWNSSWKLFNNRRVDIGYDGFTDVFIPELYTEIQGIKAHLINGDLNVEFLPTDPDQTGNVDLLQDLFNYAWERDNMDQKVDTTITEYLVTGNSYIFSYVGDDGFPTSRVVSAKDAFFDPNATDYQSLRYCGYRYLTTKQALADEQIINGNYDPEDDTSSPSQPRYTNLDKIGQYKDDSDDKTAKQEREEMLTGSIFDDNTDTVECIVYYDYDRMVTIANRSVKIEDVPTPFQRDKRTVQSADDEGNPVSFDVPEIEAFLPVAPFRNITDANLWYARGDAEIIGASQERLNDVQSQKSDNLTYQLNRMWALDPNYAQKLDEIQSVPGAVFTVPPGALEQIVTQPMGQDADIEIARLKAEMQAATGANELMSGTQMVKGGRTSMYQINAELIMLGARFKVKIHNLENEGFKILVQNMWKIMQIYIDKEIPIRAKSGTGQVWARYNPGLYLGEYDVKIQLGATADSVKEAAKQQAMQFFLLASKLPFIDQQQLFQMTATQMFDKSARDIKEMIQPPPATPPPTIVPKLIESIQFQQLYPDEQAELLAEAGVQPSPLREAQTNTPASPVDKGKVARNAAIIHNPNPTGNSTDYANAGQMAGQGSAVAPAIGPESNIPGTPNV